MCASPALRCSKPGMPSNSLSTNPESLKLSVWSKSLASRYCFIAPRSLRAPAQTTSAPAGTSSGALSHGIYAALLTTLQGSFAEQLVGHASARFWYKTVAPQGFPTTTWVGLRFRYSPPAAGGRDVDRERDHQPHDGPERPLAPEPALNDGVPEQRGG